MLMPQPHLKIDDKQCIEVSDTSGVQMETSQVDAVATPADPIFLAADENTTASTDAIPAITNVSHGMSNEPLSDLPPAEPIDDAPEFLLSSLLLPSLPKRGPLLMKLLILCCLLTMRPLLLMSPSQLMLLLISQSLITPLLLSLLKKLLTWSQLLLLETNQRVRCLIPFPTKRDLTPLWGKNFLVLKNMGFKCA